MSISIYVLVSGRINCSLKIGENDVKEEKQRSEKNDEP